MMKEVTIERKQNLLNSILALSFTLLILSISCGIVKAQNETFEIVEEDTYVVKDDTLKGRYEVQDYIKQFPVEEQLELNKEFIRTLDEGRKPEED